MTALKEIFQSRPVGSCCNQWLYLCLGLVQLSRGFGRHKGKRSQHDKRLSARPAWEVSSCRDGNYRLSACPRQVKMVSDKFTVSMVFRRKSPHLSGSRQHHNTIAMNKTLFFQQRSGKRIGQVDFLALIRRTSKVCNFHP